MYSLRVSLFFALIPPMSSFWMSSFWITECIVHFSWSSFHVYLDKRLDELFFSESLRVIQSSPSSCTTQKSNQRMERIPDPGVHLLLSVSMCFNDLLGVSVRERIALESSNRTAVDRWMFPRLRGESARCHAFNARPRGVIPGGGRRC